MEKLEKVVARLQKQKPSKWVRFENNFSRYETVRLRTKIRSKEYSLERGTPLVERTTQRFICGEGYVSESDYVPNLKSISYGLIVSQNRTCDGTTETKTVKYCNRELLKELFDYIENSLK